MTADDVARRDDGVCTMNCGPVLHRDARWPETDPAGERHAVARVARGIDRPKRKRRSRLESTSDDRTANNAVRHQYRVLSDDEKAQMQAIKDIGAAFIAKLHEIGGTEPGGNRFGSRDLALANTHAEDAVMRAVRHITA